MDKVEIPQIMYDWVKNKEKKVITRISPSLLGGCPRVHYFKIKGIEPTTPPNVGALLNFQVGFIWEELMEKALKESGVEYKYQMPLEDEELNVAGTLDFLVKTENGLVVMDSKTESVRSADYRRRAGQSYLDDHKRYIIQVGTYILLLRRKGYDIKQGRLINIVKDNGFIEEHTFDYTKALEDEILARIELLNHHLKTNTLPPCTCEGWEVGYCDYGNPNTMAENKTKKLVATECCPDLDKLELWRNTTNG